MMTTTPNKDNGKKMVPAQTRILLVDDDGLILATLTRGLQAEGYAVDYASDAESALSVAAQAEHDLAVVDIRMPGISGIELARRLRELHELPTLFVSAYDDREQIEAAAAEGGMGYVVKPVNVRQLVPAIEAALARARDLAALREAKGRLEQALEGGRNTNTAVGIVMESRHLSRDAAFQKLRAEARAQGRKLEALAGELVDAIDAANSLKSRF